MTALDDVQSARTITLAFILFDLFLLELRLSVTKSCPLYNLNALYNILMILDKNVEQDETTFHLSEWQR